MNDSLVHIQDAEFETKVLNSDLPVLVDFGAPWCGPCRMIAPIFEELSQEYDGRVVFAKMDTDENPVTPTQYRIMSIPTLMLFKDGQVADTIIGLRPKEVLKALLDKALG
jgi:thioredoxin 1